MPLESIAVTFRKGDIMSYTALYRKFRPSTFDQVKGQDHIVQTLKNQINANRIGHAYLFCGTRGTGKTSVAKIFAKAVNCEHPVDGSPCNECETCRGITNGSAMNVIEIDAASNNGVDNIRQIRDEIQYSPSSGKYTVYIIDEVHMLSIGAFNALLKTLEEPPAYVIFILATTEPHKIPITILSRCQRYDFKRISIDTIAARLSELMEKESIEVEDKAIRYVAKAADGSMRDALSLLDQCIAFYLGQKLTYDNVLDVLGAVDNEIFSRLTRSVIDSDVTTSLNILDEIIMQGREPGQFVNDFIWYLRNLMLIKTSEDVYKRQQLKEKSKVRKTTGTFTVEGKKMFVEIPAEDLVSVYVSETFLKENGELVKDKKYQIVSDQVFKKISDTVTPQGIVAVVKQKSYSIDYIIEKRNKEKSCIVVLDRLQDPGNMGTIVRTGEAAGISGIIMSKDSADIYNPKVIRSTMGSIFRVPFAIVDDLAAAVDTLKDNGITTYAAHLKGELYNSGSLTKDCALLIGNEARGLSEEISAKADKLIKIPMHGKVESLNAAVATAILMYEAAR